MIRTEARAALWRWREMAGATAMALAGGWLMALGGWFLAPLGAALAALALVWALIAWRKMRFVREVAVPGVVEVDEGQVGYFGPTFGGFVSLRELVELRLMPHQGVANWRLRQADGQVLMIPLAAQGSAALYDAFASLPGIDFGHLLAAMSAPVTQARVIWTRTKTDNRLS